MKPKPRGKDLGMKVIKSAQGHSYLVFRTLDDSFHVFKELNARDVAREEFGATSGNTRKMWRKLWETADGQID